MTCKNKALCLSLIGSAALAGCSSGSDPAPSAPRAETTNAVSIDASSYSDYVYYNLVTGEEVSLTAEQAATSSNWHIGFRRSSVILNGGTSGAGNVSGAVAASQDDFYTDGDPNDSVFLNASSQGEEEHLTANYDASSLSFSEDSHKASIQGSESINNGIYDYGWFNYNPAGHRDPSIDVFSLNDQNWWLIRSNTGTSYAKFHATAFTYTSGANLNVTFSFDVQAEGLTQFASTATFNASVPTTGGAACFDFDADNTVDCASDDWDLKLEIAERSFNLWTNGGISGDQNGAAFGPLPDATAALYTSATMAPGSGTDISRHYTADANASVFSENAWYAYNLEGNHKLWPNYRTYLIDTDSSDNSASVYKLQIINYYNELDQSGHPTFRYEAN